MEKDGKRLHNELANLKTAIEEAINKGQKSMGDLNDIPESGPVSSKKFAPTHVNSGSRVAGRLDDFHRRADGL